MFALSYNFSQIEPADWYPEAFFDHFPSASQSITFVTVLRIYSVVLIICVISFATPNGTSQI